jgi:hypothetical protein
MQIVGCMVVAPWIGAVQEQVLADHEISEIGQKQMS